MNQNLKAKPQPVVARVQTLNPTPIKSLNGFRMHNKRNMKEFSGRKLMVVKIKSDKSAFFN